MEHWHETSGLPWLQRGLVDPRPEEHLVGVALGRGYAHQPVAHLGVATAAAGVLLRELGGPVEVGGGAVEEVAAQVHLDLQHTLVLLRGTSAALRRRLERFEELLLDPSTIDLTPPSDRVPHPWAGAGRELGYWFGAGPASLSCEVDPATMVDRAAVAEALTALHPGHGTPGCAFTSLPELVGAAFRDPAPPDAPAALTWRREGPGSLGDTSRLGLLSARVGLSSAAWVAQRLLTATVHDALALTGQVEGVRPAASIVGDRRLLVLLAGNPREGYDHAATHGAVVQAVAARRETSRERVAEVLEALSSEESHASRTHPARLVVESLLQGGRLTSAGLRADLGATTPDDVRRELDVLLDRVVLALPLDAEPPAGFPLVSGPATSPAGRTRPVSVHRAQYATRLGRGDWRLRQVERRGDQLMTLGSPPGKGATTRVSDSVDLTRLVARIDQGDPRGTGSTTLVDEDDHRVVVQWPALRHRRSLLKVVDAAVPAGRTASLPPDPQWDAWVRHRRRLGHQVVAAVVVFLALVAGLIAVIVIPGGDEDDTLVTEVSAGDVVELSNGTTLQVSQLRPAPEGADSGRALLTDVRVCGGGPTQAGEARPSARNYVSPDRYLLEGTASTPLFNLPEGEERLAEVTLAEGDCLEGTVGFGVPPDVPDAGLAVVFYNNLGDQVTWR